MSDDERTKQVYKAFYERNQDGITYVDVGNREYHVVRGWTLRGPIPPGARIVHVGLKGPRATGERRSSKQ